MGFVYENQGHITYLSYALLPEDVLDTMSLGMITNNKIAGLAPGVFTQMNTTKYIKYNVSAKISVQQFFSGAVSKKQLLGVFNGIISAIVSAEDYMIDINSLLYDLDYIFVDVSTCEIIMLCMPILRENSSRVNLNTFFKNIMFSTQFNQTENCDYVAKIINHLNAFPILSLEEFKALLDSLNGESAQPKLSNASEPQKQISNPAATAPQVNNTNIKAPTAAPVKQPTVNGVNNVAMASEGKTNVNVTPASKEPPVEEPIKKKGGLFGLFSSNNKNKEKKEKTASVNASQTNSYSSKADFGTGFAVPGQKAPIVNTPAPAKEKVVLKDEKTSVTVPIVQTRATPVPINAQSQPMNFGETTILGGGTIGETTVLTASNDPNKIVTPYLIRNKNNEKIMLNKPVFRIGKERSYVDYFIGDNTAISRSHANVIIRDGEYFVVDTNSTNHTFVNGTMIQSNVETVIKHGDTIRLANEDFIFKLY